MRPEKVSPTYAYLSPSSLCLLVNGARQPIIDSQIIGLAKYAFHKTIDMDFKYQNTK